MSPGAALICPGEIFIRRIQPATETRKAGAGRMRQEVPEYHSAEQRSSLQVKLSQQAREWQKGLKESGSL